MFKRKVLLFVFLFALFLLPVFVLAQDSTPVGLPVIDTALLDQVKVLLTYLSMFAIAAYGVTELLKPVYTRLLPKDAATGDMTPDTEQLYLLALYITRTLAAFILLGSTGAYASIVGMLPLVASVPPLAVLIVAALIAGAGSGIVFQLIDLIATIKGRLGTPPTLAISSGDLGKITVPGTPSSGGIG